MIAAFEDGNDFPAALRGGLHDFMRQPGVVGLVQARVAEGVVAVCVETGGEQDQLRFEGAQARQPFVADGMAEFAAAAAFGQGCIETVAVLRQGMVVVGIQPVLTQAQQQDVGLSVQDFFAAVSSVHIEIQYGDPLQVVPRNGVHGGDGRVVDEAEAAALFAFGMMSGRAGGAKGVAYFAGQDEIDGFYHGACGDSGGFQCVVG